MQIKIKFKLNNKILKNHDHNLVYKTKLGFNLFSKKTVL